MQELFKDMTLALPVVDKGKRLVIVTVDDLIDVIEQEATRDIYAAGAVQPGDEDDYFQVVCSLLPEEEFYGY